MTPADVGTIADLQGVPSVLHEAGFSDRDINGVLESLRKVIYAVSRYLNGGYTLDGLSRFNNRWMELIRSIDSLESVRRSQSLLCRRQRPNQANVRSTTQRFGISTKPFTPSGRRTISSRHSPGELFLIQALRL